ncbi:MAG: Rpn family recombination-promoting nuclease/putative transposase [Chloroflexota bacterium]|nr:Rpn family recombination-promoting nuclease/putative transposase [Chloroflexota bacterium]
MGHDQLFKQVIESFFADFLRLFAPDTAARLDLSTVTFLNTEVFTDIPQGERRAADIVAEVRTLEGAVEIIIVHVEIQREREPDFGYRMWQYYSLLRQRENKPVMPIALVFYLGREGIAYEDYEETLFGRTILTFHYLQISLPLLQAEDYVRGQNLLGVGLASVMRLPRSRKGRIDLYLACLRRLIDAELDGNLDAARAFLLGNVVETYNSFSDEERDALRVQLEQEGDMIMDVTELTWADRIALRTALQTMRKDIRQLMQIRFGRVLPEVEARINSAESEEELEALFRHVAMTHTEDDLVREG